MVTSIMLHSILNVDSRIATESHTHTHTITFTASNAVVLLPPRPGAQETTRPCPAQHQEIPSSC